MTEQTVTRSYLAENIFKKIGITYQESAQIVEAILSEIKIAVKKDKEAKIAAFGSFYVKKKNERVGRNPKTKKEAIISSRQVVSFYASNLLKQRINK